MSDIPDILKTQSQYLQQLVDTGENLEDKLDELDTNKRLYEYNAWHQSVLNILTPLLNEIGQEDILEDIKNLSATSENIAIIRGRMAGMRQDIVKGKLNHLVYRIQKENTKDLLKQVDKLLVGDDDDEVDSYTLAAMLTATILEKSVRKLAEHKGIISESHKWTSLGSLIEQLQENNVFNNHQAKELKLWKNIRNDVAHGKFDNFTQNDVEKMIKGVKHFVDTYL